MNLQNHAQPAPPPRHHAHPQNSGGAYQGRAVLAKKPEYAGSKNPSPTLNARVATPITVRVLSSADIPEAIKAVNMFVSLDVKIIIRSLYENWCASVCAKTIGFSDSAFRRWANINIRRQGHEITPSAIDALLTLFRATACKEGYLIPNPRYTGKAPYPRYLLK